MKKRFLLCILLVALMIICALPLSAGALDAPVDEYAETGEDMLPFIPAEYPTTAPTQAPTDAPTEAPTEPAPQTDGYYLIGSMNAWMVDPAYKLTFDDGALYSIEGVSLDVLDEFKVVYSSDGTQTTTWFPEGVNNNYGSNGEIEAAGVYDIYFLSDYTGLDGWFYNCIFVTPQPVTDHLNISFSPDPNTVSIKYNGKVRNPKVTVTNDNGDVLVEGEDYVLGVPAGRVNAGDYTYTATGIGDYDGLESEGVFTISPAKIKFILNNNKLAYTGKVRNPTVYVYDDYGNSTKTNSNAFVEGRDYTLEIPEGRQAAGQYVYKLHGMGNYTGNPTRTLTIGNPIHAQLNAYTLKYNGKTRNPQLSVYWQEEIKNSDGTFTYVNHQLTEGEDYIADIPAGRKDPGEYVYTITGIGHYYGEVQLTLTINPA